MRRGRGGRARRATSSLLTDDTALMYVVIAVMGTVNGLLAGAVGYVVDVTVFGLHAAVWTFLLAWAATTSYLSYRRVPSGVLAVGLYLVGLLVLLQPVVVYGPTLAAATDAGAPDRTRLLIEGWRGIFTWGATAGVLAFALAVASRFLERRSKRALRRRYEDHAWRDRTD